MQHKISPQEKLKAVEDYLSGNRGISKICSELGVEIRALRVWIRKYKLHGASGLIKSGKNKIYSKTIKIQAVEDYLSGKGSLDQICNTYDISAHGILQQWIKKYNGHETFKSHNTQGDRCMTKGRTTTYEEKTEIVSFCIANNDDYQMTSKQFEVSYQQVYTWVKKYRDQGYEALFDRRGKRKNPEELSEAEKSSAKFKLLEAENKRLKMEIDYLKKLDEVERRR